MAKRRSREATSGIVYIIMRQLREQKLYIGSKREKKNANTENHRRVADEGNNHLDSRAIKVRLRKPTKRLTRKEWNLIRNLCSLVSPGIHEETKQRGRSGHAERDCGKEHCTE